MATGGIGVGGGEAGPEEAVLTRWLLPASSYENQPPSS